MPSFFCFRGIALTAVSLSLASTLLSAQDTRTVTEPVFPATCTTLSAQLYTQVTNGELEPSSETTFDTTRIQTALNACASGKAVELLTTATDNAFLIQPITIPTGVTLIVDGGVTVYASLNPADYQVAGQPTCGTIAATGTGCNAIITLAKGTGSGVMGYGVLNGRGGDDLLIGGVQQTYSWYNQTEIIQNSPEPPYQNNPKLITSFEANNSTLYKITLLNSPFFTVSWYGYDSTTAGSAISGLTIWGIKILTPHSVHNTDGIDPEDNFQNVTISNSYISNGDDDIAIDSDLTGYPVGDVTIQNVHTYSGLGISIGSHTEGGVSNVLINNAVQSGISTDSETSGFRIKSALDRGGLVNNVTYQNVCLLNTQYIFDLYPHYDATIGTFVPQYTNVYIHNVTVLPWSDGSGNSGEYVFQGYSSSYKDSIALDNVNILGMPNLTTNPSHDATLTLGPGPVTPSSLVTLTGSNLTVVNGITNPTEAAYPCVAPTSTSAGSFQPLVGELYATTSTATNLHSASATYPGSLTLDAVIQPGSEEYPAIAQPITFYDGATAVGNASIMANSTGTFVPLPTLTGISAGTHTYTATYPGDTNYPGTYTFGSVTLTVAAAATTTTLATIPTPQAAYTPITLKATLASTAGTPSGVVTFLVNGTAIPGSFSLNAGVATTAYTFTATGLYTITASYAAQGNYAASASSSQSVTITPATPSFTFATPSPAALTLTPGASGTTQLSVLPIGGFTGSVALTCATPLSYVACMVPGPAVITGTSAVAVTATITVPATIGSNSPNSPWPARIVIAFLLPYAALVLWPSRRRAISLFLVLPLLMAMMVSLTGCGSGSTSSSGSNPVVPPAGTVTLVFTATSGAIVLTQNFTLTIN